MNFTNVTCAIVGLLLPLFHAITASAQTLKLQGQLSSWIILNDQGAETAVLGLRYLPTLTIDKPLPEDRRVDVELSMNAYASAPVGDSGRSRRLGEGETVPAVGAVQDLPIRGAPGAAKAEFRVGDAASAADVVRQRRSTRSPSDHRRCVWGALALLSAEQRDDLDVGALRELTAQGLGVEPYSREAPRSSEDASRFPSRAVSSRSARIIGGRISVAA